MERIEGAANDKKGLRRDDARGLASRSESFRGYFTARRLEGGDTNANVVLELLEIMDNTPGRKFCLILALDILAVTWDDRFF